MGLGSKRSDAESIGQYGIGFNVIYHLTDCPSFITGGETLCITDPHCRFVPEASTEMPGRRFDDLKSGFWEDFPDLKSAYLQDGLKDCPPELLGGSLFRFPIRHTYNLMRFSKIVDHSTSYTNEPLTADRMHRYLTDWAPKMKQALLFLNHVTELCFFTIEDHKQVMLSSSRVSYTSIPSLVSEHCFQVCIDESGKQSRAQLHEKFTAFKEERGSEPCVVRYPLTITETLPDTLMKMEKQKTEEKWLIQEGIGDLEDKQQTWNYISLVKPKHGIAAPLSSSTEHIRAFFGNVFCFLPLPVSCNLPVHVNPHFILNASRRNLWQSTVPGEVDDKSKWNENLLKAISSSYADFLVHARSYYIKSEPYNDLSTLQNDLRCYYSVFPNWSKGEFHSRCVPEGPWLKLAEDIYRKLASHNANVLATIESTQSIHSTTTSFQIPSGPNVQHTMKWHPMKNSESPSSQVYFWAPRADHNDAPVKPILERIGMKITCAPLRIKNHFHTVECDIPETSPSSVYDYYTQFSGQGSPNGRFSCAVEATTFQSIADFKVFTEYLLQPSESEPGNREFSKTPFDHPLLLTADGQLRNFDERNKVISSEYSQLFPKSFEKFLHPELLELKYTTNCFLSPVAEDDPWSCTIPEILQGILSKALPHALHTTHVHNACEHIIKPELIELWACLSSESDKTFSSHLRNILQAWALLPSTTNQLFSSRNMLLPVIPLTSIPKKADFSEIYKLLQHLGMPFLATDVVHTRVVQRYCPQLSDYEHILTNLYHLHRETDISSMITKDNVTTLITYLRNTNFCKYECQKCVKALPLFLRIEGNLTALGEKTVYIWPTNACRIGYSRWLNRRNTEFLDRHGEWTRLGHESDLEIQKISAEQLYIDYIFSVFYQFSEEERFKHLKHIRNHLFGRNILNQQSGSPSQNEQAQRFFDKLRNLRCLGRDGEHLKQASEVCTNEKIFTTFAEHFYFLSECFTSDEDECRKWLKFFCAIGLRESITKEEYQQFCTETAGGRHPDPKQTSLVLLDYLFSEQAENDEWNTDHNFLSCVSHIPFVCTETLPELSWIEPVGLSEKGRTKLAGTALDEHSSLLWTVKPIVHLPCNSQVERDENILASLQVTTSPSIADVMTNLLTITKSRFANFELFDKCPQNCRPPENATGLVEVLLKHFEYLNSLSGDQPDLQLLSSLSCVPVYATPDQSVVAPSVPVVLVKPNHVLTDRDAQEYYPFLHCIPNELASVLPLLQQIGVKNSFELEHMRIALENVYKCSDQLQLEFNTEDKVVKVIERLYTMLEQIRRAGKMGDEDIVSALKPLYLPSREGKLVCTSKLVYCDSIMYKRCELDHLAEANLFLLHLPNTHYKFNERMFCEYLPEAIRPKGLSTCCEQTCCEQTLREECTIVDVSEPCFANNLKVTFALPEFPKAVLVALEHFTGDDEVCKNFEQFLQNFLKIRVFAIKNDLQTDIILTTVQPKQTLGRATVDFYLQRDEHSFDFYAKLGMSDVRKFYMFEYLAEYLISAVKSVCANISFATHSELKRFLTMLLMTHTAEDIHDVLDEQKLFLDSAVTPKLGMLIPESWHQCLGQDISNLFDRKEQVGYKDEEGNLILAQVIHPVVAEDGGSCSSEDPTCMRYKICASENDEEGIEVSALDLCKISQEKRAVTGEIIKEESKVVRKPNPEEGKRWVKQAEVEFRALKVLLKEVQTQPDLSCTVCFMAHQVAERALKGGMYGKCGFYYATHDLYILVNELKITDQNLLDECATTLDGYYQNTRYPDRHPSSSMGNIPSDNYSPQDAQQAKKKAETILDLMKTLVNS